MCVDQLIRVIETTVHGVESHTMGVSFWCDGVRIQQYVCVIRVYPANRLQLRNPTTTLLDAFTCRL
jgi:hypothetical protein